MEVAVLGWGSLIWCPGCLMMKTQWHVDGPELPIEFARISGDKRMTLVIHPRSPNQRTYWALSQFGTPEDARENLRVREGTVARHIHSLTKDGKETGEMGREVATKIREWLSTQQHLQAAVWTGLPSNWNDHRGHAFTPDDAVVYANELERARDAARADYDRAREYVSNAPSQIQTPARKLLREKMGWVDATLSPALFVT
jgi:hypothetical protein